MTQKQFKEGLFRGQGRCILAVQAEPDKYYQLVLWACSHELAFDAQFEGSRSWFVYQLIDCYEDRAPFIEAVIQSLKRTKSDGGFRMLYLTELLYFLACDGEAVAKQALQYQYEKLYTDLFKIKRRPHRIFHERDDYAMICEVLGERKKFFIKIANDIGRLYLDNSFYNCHDFDWLYDSLAKPRLSTLKKEAKKSENIAAYLRMGKIYEDEWENRKNNPISNRPKRSTILSLWLKRRADKATVLQYAQNYQEQSEPEARAEALTAFCRCPYPENPLPVIKDASSDCDKLKTAAWKALENIRHPLVREFAMQHLTNDSTAVLPIIITNYQPDDASLLENLLTSLPVDFNNTSGWHDIQMDILEMAHNNLKAPAALLLHIYETTYCSWCRERTLRQMAKRRMVTDEMLQECLWDCNSDIRSYARACLNRRARYRRNQL